MINTAQAQSTVNQLYATKERFWPSPVVDQMMTNERRRTTEW